MTKWVLRIFWGLVLFVVAVNLIWWVAPALGHPDVYRPLFAIVVIIVADRVWKLTRSPRP